MEEDGHTAYKLIFHTEETVRNRNRREYHVMYFLVKEDAEKYFIEYRVDGKTKKFDSISEAEGCWAVEIRYDRHNVIHILSRSHEEAESYDPNTDEVNFLVKKHRNRNEKYEKRIYFVEYGKLF